MNVEVIYDPRFAALEDEVVINIANGDYIANRYHFANIIGTGAFSTVYRARDDATNLEVSIKVVTSGHDTFFSGMKEVQLLQSMESVHIVTFVRSFISREHLFIVTELLGQNLRQHYEPLSDEDRIAYYSEAMLKHLCRDVLLGVSFIHQNGIIHCDIKPDNICMINGRFKIIDMGSAVTIHDTLYSYIQSRWYRAPEVMLGAPCNNKIDCWGAGLSVIEILIGAVVLHQSTVEAMLAAQIAVCGPMPQWLVDINLDLSRMFFTDNNMVYQIHENQAYILEPRTDVQLNVLISNAVDDNYGDVNGIVDLMSSLIVLDPNLRLTADDALAHAWLQ